MQVLRRLLLTSVLLAGLPALLRAQSPQLEYEGAQALGIELRRLNTTHRVLMIGAHPDDENTAVLAALALGQGADVAYLSLTRGEGGQNAIGPELQEGLGLIRSEELLAARRIDGAQQFFTRAYDFGFSKSADEAFRHWPRDSVLADMVAVIRVFRPDVILTIWSGTPQDGHGHHQAAGILAREAFEAAADPARFAAQADAGLRPHRARHLFQAAWRGGANAALFVETGTLDPLFGRSHHQIAMESRSRHRSQDQGSPEAPGPQRVGLIPIATATPSPASMYDGLPAGLAAAAGGRSAALRGELAAFEQSAAAARAAFNPLTPGAIVGRLERALASLERADSLAGSARAAELQFRIRAERASAQAALLLAAGVRVDAIVDDDRVVPGDSFTVTIRVWNGGSVPVGITDLAPVVPIGWVTRPIDAAPANVAPAEISARRFRVHVPLDTRLSEPYFLGRARTGDSYHWPDDVSLRSAAFERDAVSGSALLRVRARTIDVMVPAVYARIDPFLGEQPRRLLVVPAVSVRVEPRLVVVPQGDAPDAPAQTRGVTVELRSEAAAELAGLARLEVPEGWAVQPAAWPVRFTKAGEQVAVKFDVTPTANTPAGRHAMRAVFESNGNAYRRGYAIVEYPHTTPRLLFHDAAATIASFPVAVPAGVRAGYIEGAGDAGPAALAQLGVTVELLDSNTLRAGDLSRFDVLIAGIRAYEVRPDLAQANARILDWVAAGGRFIVQYHRQDYPTGGFAPYTIAMAQSADRVTDENAPVRFLAPEHPILTSPNRITASDFEGWVQERGLYFLSRWDDRFTALLEMSDPGEPPRQGSLVVARVGQGSYVYIALSLFRQLPEGVPGAYRLLANLLQRD
jgi:LmbE family N-acetylglucosaminyl deacetylase